MKEIKLLEIGAEDGSLEFYSIGTRSKTKYVIGANRNEKFQSFHDMLTHYTNNNDPLLWYFPVEVHPGIIDELLTILLKEYQHHPKDHFTNLERWEKMLDIQFIKMTNDGLKTFNITPVQIINSHNYNHFGDERVLESITTEYSNKPNQNRILTGIGSIEGNTFVVRDKDSVILGVFPLERYEIELSN